MLRTGRRRHICGTPSPCIQSEEELEEFFGKLVKAAGSFIKSPVGKTLGGVLKNVARTALPVAGAALGNLVAPGVGG